MRLLAYITLSTGFAWTARTTHNLTTSIISAAQADGIDLCVLPFASEALASVNAMQVFTSTSVPTALANATKVDDHAHIIPTWYRSLVPTTGGLPTPNWTLEDHLDFMAMYGIKKSILSISSPGSVVYPGDEMRSRALARLLNEYLAAVVRTVPEHFDFYSVTPLPYTAAAISEAQYASSRLGAIGIGLLSNHEGYYLGNPRFTPFFSAINAASAGSTTQQAIFVHPTGPCLHGPNSTLIDANPTLYPDGLVEFYFETARTFMDLTNSLTVVNFTKIDWVVPHAGGAFPAIEDRFITADPPALIASSKAAYATRFFWDTAGPVFPHQVVGLLGYGVPSSQLVYGSDYPYAPSFTYGLEIGNIENATFLTAEEKIGIFETNSESILR